MVDADEHGGRDGLGRGYRFRADGSLTLTLDWDPMKSGDWRNLPSMPVFGFLFQMDADCDRFSWYGRGPAENYVDRCRGARLGIYRSRVRDNMSPYLVPQECGNRTEVRWLKVSDMEGHSIGFRAVNKPFDASVLPYTAEELESATHREDLPAVRYTVVNILGAMRGVGGDDSWGAPVHPEYCISGEEELITEFIIEKR